MTLIKMILFYKLNGDQFTPENNRIGAKLGGIWDDYSSVVIVDKMGRFQAAKKNNINEALLIIVPDAVMDKDVVGYLLQFLKVNKEAIIVLHGFSDFRSGHEKVLQKYASNFREYHRSKEDYFYKYALSILNRNIDNEARSSIEINTDQNIRKSIHRSLSDVKHAIAHIFLALDADLQYLTKADNKQRKLEGMKSKYTGESSLSKKMKDLEDKIVGDGKNKSANENIETIIGKNIREQKKDIADLLTKIKIHCDIPSNVKQVNDDNGYTISCFMMLLKNLLNSKIYDPIKVEELLCYGDDKNASDITWFHSWFKKLDSMLGKLTELTASLD
jgi:hypothetical protein